MTTRWGILLCFQGISSILCIAPLKTLLSILGFYSIYSLAYYGLFVLYRIPETCASVTLSAGGGWKDKGGENILFWNIPHPTVDNIVLWSDPLIQDWYHELVLHILSFCRRTTPLIYKTADSAMVTLVPCTRSISIDIITTMISTRPLGFDIHSSQYTSTLCFIQMEVCVTHWSKPSFH